MTISHGEKKFIFVKKKDYCFNKYFKNEQQKVNKLWRQKPGILWK